MELPKVLVACPTYEGKIYCFDRWIEAVKSLDYPNYDILVVDNSANSKVYSDFSSKVPIIPLPVVAEKEDYLRIAYSMEEIKREFLARDYDYWLNIESDVIVPADTIIKLLPFLQMVDLTAHYYPDRNEIDGDQIMLAFGLTVFSRRVIENISFIDCDASHGCDGSFFQNVKKIDNFTMMELYQVVKGVKHLWQ